MPYGFLILRCMLNTQVVQPAIDLRSFSNPLLALTVRHAHDLVMRPVQIVRKIRYLLDEPLGGVARYPPRLAVSTSKAPWQCGQVTPNRV